MTLDLKAANNILESEENTINSKRNTKKKVFIGIVIIVFIFLVYIAYVLYRNYSSLDKIKAELESVDIVSFCNDGVELKVVLSYEHELDIGLSIALETLNLQLFSKGKYLQAASITLASPLKISSKKALKEIILNIKLSNFDIIQDFITNLMSNFSFFIKFTLKTKLDIAFYLASFIKIHYQYRFNYDGTISVFNRKFIFLNDKLIYQKKTSGKSSTKVNYDVGLTKVTFSVCKLIKDIPIYFSIPKLSIDVLGWSPDSKTFDRLITNFAITELAMDKGKFCLSGWAKILNAKLFELGSFYKYFRSVGYFSVKVKLSSDNDAREIAFCPYLVDNLKEREFAISIVKKLKIVEG